MEDNRIDIVRGNSLLLTVAQYHNLQPTEENFLSQSTSSPVSVSLAWAKPTFTGLDVVPN